MALILGFDPRALRYSSILLELRDRERTSLPWLAFAFGAMFFTIAALFFAYSLPAFSLDRKTLGSFLRSRKESSCLSFL